MSETNGHQNNGGNGNAPDDGGAVTLTNLGDQLNYEGDSATITLQASDTTSGSTLTYYASGLPGGLTLNNSSGVISGTLSGAAVTSTFTVGVQDSDGNSATKSLTITVGTALTISTVSLPAGGAGSAYPSTTLAANGGTGAAATLPGGVSATVLDVAAGGGVWNDGGTLTVTNSVLTNNLNQGGSNGDASGNETVLNGGGA